MRIERRREPGRLRALSLASVLALVAAMATSTPLTGAQELPAERPWPLVLTNDPYHQLGNRGYAKATFGMLAREHEADELGALKSVVPDLLSTNLVFVGEHGPAAERDAALREAVGRTRPESAPSLDGFTARPAVEVVLELARGRRVVMFNEEHRSSRQRAFMHSLLEGLRAEGFTHFACETLTEDDALVERGYATVTSGTYTRDPVYGDLLRRAVASGFRLARYEATAEQQAPGPDDDPRDPLARTNRREVGQAENLARVLADEQARVVVFAGRHHISEEAGEWTPMASVLKARTGIDPLTADLMIMEELTRPEHEHAARRAAIEAGLLGEEPVVLFDEAGKPWTALPGALDLVVFFPASGDVHGRPDWLQLGGLRRPVEPELNAEALDALDELAGPALLQAIFEGEDTEQAVPADQVVLRPGAERPPLLLRDGAYVLRLVDEQGEVVWRGELTVAS